MPARHSRGYDTARARLIAARFIRDDRPRIKIRIDPIIHRSLLVLAVGVALILLGIAIAPA